MSVHAESDLGAGLAHLPEEGRIEGSGARSTAHQIEHRPRSPRHRRAELRVVERDDIEGAMVESGVDTLSVQPVERVFDGRPTLQTLHVAAEPLADSLVALERTHRLSRAGQGDGSGRVLQVWAPMTSCIAQAKTLPTAPESAREITLRSDHRSAELPVGWS